MRKFNCRNDAFKHTVISRETAHLRVRANQVKMKSGLAFGVLPRKISKMLILRSASCQTCFHVEGPMEHRQSSFPVSNPCLPPAIVTPYQPRSPLARALQLLKLKLSFCVRRNANHVKKRSGLPFDSGSFFGILQSLFLPSTNH